MVCCFSVGLAEVCLVVVFDDGGVLGFDLFGVCVLLGLLVCFDCLSF